MRICELKEGEFASRSHWGKSSLAITRMCGELYYYNLEFGLVTGKLRKDSSAYDRNDFKLIEGVVMRTEYTKDSVIVADSNGKLFSYPNEDEALKSVAGMLQADPLREFTMFKPYQQIKPKVPDLSELIVPMGE